MSDAASSPRIPSAGTSPDTDPRFTLLEHLGELRTRLGRALLCVMLGTVLTVYFVDHLFHFLIVPILPYLPEPKKLVVISPLEQVVTYLRIAVISGVFVSSPGIFWQVWGFIAPGLYPSEKKFVLPFIFFGSFFFIGGAAFAYYLMLPQTFKFLIEVLPQDVLPQFTVEKYFSLVTQIILAMGVIFELPLLIAMLALAGIVTTKQLKKFRKYNVVVAFVVSAFLTPTVDPYSQTLMAAPLIVFYEVGIIFAWFTERRRKRDAAQAAAENTDPPA
jgi:sec-independent protein translocase protein TatC